MNDEKNPAEVCHYIRGRLAALDADVHALKTARADRRFQLGNNVGLEVARIRHALGYLPADCNYGKQATNNIMPELGEFARLIVERFQTDGLDAASVAEIATRCGVLVLRTVKTPCGDPCYCAEYTKPGEHVECLRVNVDGTVIDPRALKAHGGEA